MVGSRRGNTVYAATAGGLSISTDGGATFTTRTTANGLGNNFVFGVYAVDSTVFAATYGGLGISTDGGATFTNRTSANGLADLANYLVYGVHAGGDAVYAATRGGLAISTDGGASFANRTTADGLGDDTVFGVYAVGSVVYAATRGGLGISTDGGASFTTRTTGDELGPADGELDETEHNTSWVYASGSTVYAATLGGLSVSTDGGATFTTRTTANGLGSNTVSGVYATAMGISR